MIAPIPKEVTWGDHDDSQKPIGDACDPFEGERGHTRGGKSQSGKDDGEDQQCSGGRCEAQE